MLFEYLGGNLTMTTHPNDTSLWCVEDNLTLEQTSLVAKKSGSITGGAGAATDRLFMPTLHKRRKLVNVG